MNPIVELHWEAVQAANQARTFEDRLRLRGVVLGIRDAVSVMRGPPYAEQLAAHAETSYHEQGINRPMIGGLFTDWEAVEGKAA